MITQVEVEEAIGPLEKYRQDCHAASLALVRSDLLGTQARVARGSCRGVGGQHSWVVRGDQPEDCYDPAITIIDVTLWSYDDAHPTVWIGNLGHGLHRPHGAGSIWQVGLPEAGGGPEASFTVPLSDEAEDWRKVCRRMTEEPLDARFWGRLVSNFPMGGWPSREFVEAMLDTPSMSALVPIDIAGMVTNRNPGGLYMKEN